MAGRGSAINIGSKINGIYFFIGKWFLSIQSNNIKTNLNITTTKEIVLKYSPIKSDQILLFIKNAVTEFISVACTPEKNTRYNVVM